MKLTLSSHVVAQVVGGELLLLDSTTQRVYSLAVSDVVDHSDDFRSLTVSDAAAGFAVSLCEEGLATTTTSGLSRRALVGTGGAAVGAGLLALSLPTAAAASSAVAAIGFLVVRTWEPADAFRQQNPELTGLLNLTDTDRVLDIIGVGGAAEGPQPAPYPIDPLPSPALTGSLVIAGKTYQAQLRRLVTQVVQGEPDRTAVSWVANADGDLPTTASPFVLTYTFNGVTYEVRDS
jgi:hypothetical protein